MGEVLHDNAILDDRSVKTRRLIFKLDIDSDGAPETHTISGVPGNVVISYNEGDTATADAVEADTCWDNGYTACFADACGHTGFLIDVSELEVAGVVIAEVLGVNLLRGFHPVYVCGAIDERDVINLLGDDLLVEGVTASTGITPLGNIAFELINVGLDFTCADYTQVFEVIYTIR